MMSTTSRRLFTLFFLLAHQILKALSSRLDAFQHVSSRKRNSANIKMLHNTLINIVYVLCFLLSLENRWMKPFKMWLTAVERRKKHEIDSAKRQTNFPFLTPQNTNIWSHYWIRDAQRLQYEHFVVAMTTFLEVYRFQWKRNAKTKDSRSGISVDEVIGFYG